MRLYAVGPRLFGVRLGLGVRFDLRDLGLLFPRILWQLPIYIGCTVIVCITTMFAIDFVGHMGG